MSNGYEYEIISHLPEHILELLFSYLDLTDIRNCMLVCKKWYTLLCNEKNEVWRVHCLRFMSENVIKSDLLSSLSTYKAKLRAYFHSWNPNDCSRNVYIKPNGFTLHRNPVAQSTDAVRGKMGFHQVPMVQITSFNQTLSLFMKLQYMLCLICNSWIATFLWEELFIFTFILLANNS